MTVILGEGQYRYEVRNDWAKLPDGWSFTDVAAVAVDHNDNVYAFNRSEHPMMVFDPRRQLPALLGRGRVQERPRHPHWPRWQSLVHRRRRPHRSASDPGGQSAADPRHGRQASRPI